MSTTRAEQAKASPDSPFDLSRFRVLLFAALAVTTACAGDSSSESSTSESSTPGDSPTAAYEACLADAGYILSEMGARPIGSGDPASPYKDVGFQRAERRCIVQAGIGEIEGDSPDEVAAKDAQAIGITRCMRERGWTMPDPRRDPVTGYLIPGSPAVPDDSDTQTALLADLTACGEEFGIEVEGD